MGERRLVSEKTTRAYSGDKPSEAQWQEIEVEGDAFATRATQEGRQRDLMAEGRRRLEELRASEGRRGKPRK